MIKLKLKDFSQQELVNAICTWLTLDRNFNSNAKILAEELKNGKWLEHFEEQLNNEN